MILYLVRHGDYDLEATSDEARVLSPKGHKITAAMARLLTSSGFDSPEIIVTSPLIRARETARIMAKEFAPNATIEINGGLLSGRDIESAMSIIASNKKECDVLMLVGHDPLLSVLASVLLNGNDVPVIEMRKSTVAIFELTRFEIPRMRGVLRAYLPPSIV